MTVEEIIKEDFDWLLGLQIDNPNLTYDNKGYEEIDETTLTEEDRMVRDSIEVFLKEKIKGFSRFQNFKLDASGEVIIRFQYDYSADKEGSTQFIGVGYINLKDWLKGGYTE
jgi:hypothetical protein